MKGMDIFQTNSQKINYIKWQQNTLPTCIKPKFPTFDECKKQSSVPGVEEGRTDYI